MVRSIGRSLVGTYIDRLGVMNYETNFSMMLHAMIVLVSLYFEKQLFMS